jgi:hypothetical protein
MASLRWFCRCCDAVKSFTSTPTQCQCDRALLLSHSAVGLSTNGINGVIKFILAACKFEVAACS